MSLSESLERFTTTVPSPDDYPPTVLSLPTPPSDVETLSFADRQVAVIVGASMLSVLCLVISQLHFIGLRPWLLLLVPFLGFTFVYYLVSLRITAFSRNFDLRVHAELVESWRPSTWPSVDVLLPICNEGMDVLVNTWSHVAELARCYAGDVVVHVLDDGANPEAESAARGFGFRYTVRPNRGWYKKAGNLRHGYETSSGDFIVIFDADFCPRTDFLDQLLPYHAADPGLGIVQSPQYFRSRPGQTWMERGAGSVQELFYRMVQVSRNRLGAAICVGSCAIYRRSALADIGGTALIEHSEDVHTGFDLGVAGWRLRYVPVPLATGLCPEEPDAFLTQQYRWCSGSMSLLSSRKFWTGRVGLGARMCYVSGFCYYIHTAVFTFVTPLVPIALVMAEPRAVQLHNYLWILPSTVYNLVIFPCWNRGRYGPTSLMAKYLYGWAHAFAIMDSIRGKQMGWQATGGKGAKSKTGRIWRAMTIWGFATTLVWVGGATIRGVQFGPGNWFFIWLTGVFYGAILAMALWSRRHSFDRRSTARLLAAGAASS